MNGYYCSGNQRKLELCNIFLCMIMYMLCYFLGVYMSSHYALEFMYVKVQILNQIHVMNV